MFRLFLATGLAALCFQVSAAELPLPLAPQLPVEVVVESNRLEVDASPATGAGVFLAGGGVLAIMVAQGLEKNSVDGTVEPMRVALKGHSFQDRAVAIFQARLATEGVSPQPSVTAVTPNGPIDTSKLPQTAMVLRARYAIDAAYDAMVITVHADVFERSLKKNGKVKKDRLFSRDYAYTFPMRRSNDRRRDWVHMGPERLPNLVDQGLSQLADMIAYDLSAEGRKESRKIRGKPSTTLVKGKGYPGWPVRRTDEWSWLRSMDGAHIALKGYQPIDGSGPSPLEAAAIPEALRRPAAAATAVAPANVVPSAAPANTAAPAAPAAPGN